MKQRKSSIIVVILSLLLITLACNAQSTEPGQDPIGITAEPVSRNNSGFRYDNIPEEENVSQAMAQFQAVTRWSKVDLTYIFLNATETISGEIEKALVRQAFDLWASHTPLTLPKSRSGRRLT